MDKTSVQPRMFEEVAEIRGPKVKAPKLGDIVHYVDGGGYERAAIVSDIRRNGSVWLTVFLPEDVVGYAKPTKPGTYHFPEEEPVVSVGDLVHYVDFEGGEHSAIVKDVSELGARVYAAYGNRTHLMGPAKYSTDKNLPNSFHRLTD